MESNAQAQTGQGEETVVVEELDHVAINVRDLERSADFYTRVVGLKRHPTKSNWFLIGNHGAINVLPVLEGDDPTELYPTAHLAFRVESLEATRDAVLAAGVVPWQNSLQWESRDITDDAASLDWGIGTLFIRDPDGNAIEFIQAGRGIFAEHPRA